MDASAFPAYMTIGQVLAWIDGRIPLTQEAWLSAFAGRLRKDWGVPILDDHLADAINARSARRGWRPWGPWPQGEEPKKDLRLYRASARRLMRERGGDVNGLADEVRADVAHLRDADRDGNQRLEAATASLRSALEGGAVSAWGWRVKKMRDLAPAHTSLKRVKRKTFAVAATTINPTLSPCSAPPLFGGWIASEDEPGGWVHVRFSREEVVSIWQPHAALAAASSGNPWPTPERTRQAECDEWMVKFARDYVSTKGRPPQRDAVAVYAANQARPDGPGFPQNVARTSYSRLPAELKAPSRKPPRSPPR